MKNTLTNKIIVVSGIVTGIAGIAYLANGKNKKFAIAGGVLGLIVAVWAMPKILKSETMKVII